MKLLQFLVLLMLSIFTAQKSFSQPEKPDKLKNYEEYPNISLKDRLELVKLYENKGDSLCQFSAYAAISYYQKANNLLQDIINPKGKHRISQKIGKAYYELDDYENALRVYYRLLDTYQSHNDTLNIARTHSTLGSLYSNLNNNEKAIKHQNLAFKHCELVGSKVGLAAISNNVASLYFDADSVEKAFQCVRYAQNLNLESGNTYWLGINYSVYADFFKDLGQYDSARYYLNKYKTILEKEGNSADSIDFFRKMGIYYYYVDSIPSAIKQFNKGVLLSRKTGKIKAEANLNHWLSEVYQSTEILNQALAHLTIYHELLDSLADKQNTESIAGYETLFQVKELEQKIYHSNLETRQAKKKTAELNKQILFISIVGLVLSILLSIMVLQNRRQNESNKTLMKLNLKEQRINSEPDEKYINSNLSDTQKTEIIQNFEKLILVTKKYTDQELTLESVAKTMKVSRTYLSQAINAFYGHSFSAVVTENRIQLAKKYLLSSTYENYSIKGVAETVGYKSVSSFNTAFKKITGLTPSYYRKNAKK